MACELYFNKVVFFLKIRQDNQLPQSDSHQDFIIKMVRHSIQTTVTQVFFSLFRYPNHPKTQCLIMLGIYLSHKSVYLAG
jgi:hypothetical protein